MIDYEVYVAPHRITRDDDAGIFEIRDPDRVPWDRNGRHVLRVSSDGVIRVLNSLGNADGEWSIGTDYLAMSPRTVARLLATAPKIQVDRWGNQSIARAS